MGYELFRQVFFCIFVHRLIERLCYGAKLVIYNIIVNVSFHLMNCSCCTLNVYLNIMI